MEKNWDIVEVLRHSRHDWLNRLQLIKGNLDLDKMDRAKAIIDEIIIETQQESKLSNIKMPMFASLLLKANWEKHHFHLEYEVLKENETQSGPVDEKVLTKWTAAFFSVLDFAVEEFQENNLSICIDQVKDGICFFFEFSGKIVRTKLINAFLEEQNELDISVSNFSDRELTLKVFMPFR
ncbi:sporulation protein [Neobacillus notoginsengisoli]|uniref:Sporulation protein n=1 Tax=Neobacillus notoginsengisoli TaxID=1578198 RepID=A0A417YTV0_9BACI|nr:Spo0B C-terminal domain-containing protein [Neobacillus notoginsengisoli]RHW40624.1 sporulation protein [Neobacillus notoginsengisoli]